LIRGVRPSGATPRHVPDAGPGLRGHRTRGVMTRGAQPEAGIQHAVCEHLRLRAKPDVLWLHVPNGGLRNKREPVRFKRMGVLAGASDLLLWHRGNSFALELKSPGGRLSDAQFEFLARFNDAGGHSANAEGLDRALACLEAWGLLRGRSAGNEIAREHLRETAGWRHRLPDRRLSESFDIEIGGLEYTATVSRFSDGRIGEVFLGNHKSNSSAD